MAVFLSEPDGVLDADISCRPADEAGPEGEGASGELVEQPVMAGSRAAAGAARGIVRRDGDGLLGEHLMRHPRVRTLGCERDRGAAGSGYGPQAGVRADEGETWSWCVLGGGANGGAVRRRSCVGRRRGRGGVRA
ncbi:hypothetical protein GCM10014715_09090 [Streptomyces spiralis]|uniref:Uncharacterized protein n=1 Tax=Streptomyces spiralis TaxID=66376 RepID=A0A918ZKM5_9ACTN|nr:hypothetical protein GCM10014715_09090 [Streptomyces spiralis]